MNFSSRRVNFVPLPAWIYGRSTPDEKAVLGALQYHFPNIEPSLDRIVELSGVSKSSVLRVIQRLESRGWITVARTPKTKGKKVRNCYELNIFNNVVENSSSVTVEPLENLEVSQWNYQKCQTTKVRGSKPGQFRGSTVTPKLNKHQLNQKELNQETRQVTFKKNLTPTKTPLYPPVGESGNFPDPWLCEEPGIEKQVSQQPAEKLQAPPSTTDPIEPSSVLTLPPATQPQPQQPVKPWEPAPLETPRDPAPTPAEEIAPAPAPDAATAKPRRKAPRFVASEAQIPADLLPVASELLAFWASKGGKKSDQAWTRTISAAQAIQRDPRGGTEILRRQLRQGAADGWAGLSFANWERFGEKARPGLGSRHHSGEELPPWRQSNLRGLDLAAAAEALAVARDDRNGLAYQEGPQQASETLLGASPCVVDAEVVA